MIIKIGIADSDREYVSRLENVLSGYDDVEIYTYTDPVSIQEYLTDTRLDVLLFNDDMYFSGIGRQSKLAILLLDETGEVKPELAAFEKVQKYQRISNIYKAIIEQYAGVAGIMDEKSGGRAKIVTCWSPVGGIGKTTFSMALASRLARDGKRVFYINFETYPSDGAYLEDKLGRGVRELAADLHKDISFELKIKGILQEKIPNFFYMNHFDKVIDFKDTSEAELKELVGVLSEHGGFDYIFIDIDASSNSKNEGVLEMADRIILLGSDDLYAAQKMKSFYDELTNKEMDLRKYISVRNKMTPNTVFTVENEINVIANFPFVNGTNDVIINSLANNQIMNQVIGAI